MVRRRATSAGRKRPPSPTLVPCPLLAPRSTSLDFVWCSSGESCMVDGDPPPPSPILYKYITLIERIARLDGCRFSVESLKGRAVDSEPRKPPPPVDPKLIPKYEYKPPTNYVAEVFEGD